MGAVSFNPHKYQERAIKFMIGQGAAGLFLDPGLGKTAITLSVLSILFKKGMINRVLIVAPLNVCYNTWPDEIEKWKQFNHLTYSILHGNKKDSEYEYDTHIHLINPEGLDWLYNTKRDRDYDVLVVDESSKFKNPQTKRFKNIMRHFAAEFQRRYILTGSPAPNGLINLFGQIFILDLGAALGRYITHYRNQFFYPSGFGGYTWELQPGAEERIYDAIDPLVMRLSAEDYLELPPLISDLDNGGPTYVDLPSNAQKIYNEMETLMIAEIEAGEIVAANGAVASQKCRQIANGGIYLDNPPEIDQFLDWLEEHDCHALKIGRKTYKKGLQLSVEDIHDVKARAVAELVDELEGQPCLVAYEFKHDLARLKKALGADVPHIGGGVSQAVQKRIISDWNAGKIPVLLGQPASMAHGLNMQGAGRAVIFHSLIWDFEAYDQFIKRIWRQGQKERVFLYHIAARGTVDEIILQRLKEKDFTQRKLFNALKQRARARRGK